MYICGLSFREKLNEIHGFLRERIEIKSCRMKAWYDRGVNKKNLEKAKRSDYFIHNIGKEKH